MATPQVVQANDWFRAPENFPSDYVLVAEGDSWFSTNGNGDNLLKALDLPGSGKRSVLTALQVFLFQDQAARAA
jgi:hypothetical protein